MYGSEVVAMVTSTAKSKSERERINKKRKEIHLKDLKRVSIWPEKDFERHRTDLSSASSNQNREKRFLQKMSNIYPPLRSYQVP